MEKIETIDEHPAEHLYPQSSNDSVLTGVFDTSLPASVAEQIKEIEDQACSMQDESGSDLVSPSKRESFILNRIKLWP